jgi:hypothetical protein
MSKLTRAIGAAKLAMHAKSPTLFVVGGVIAMGAAAVVACRQTVKADGVLEPHTIKLEELKSQEAAVVSGREKGSISDIQAEKTQIYINGFTEVAKVYAVPVVMFVGGAVMVFRGHSIMQQRNAALAVAFTTLKRNMDAYRARVIAEQGHEADQRFMSGSKETISTKDGYPRKIDTRDFDTADDHIYNRVFSQVTSNQWQNDLGANMHFIACQQRFAQQALNKYGYLYLSEVYRSLGIAESSESRICGWKITYLPDGTRNIPIVDFGIDKPLSNDWKYSAERAVYLDFNCQGLIVGGKVQKILEAS